MSKGGNTTYVIDTTVLIYGSVEVFRKVKGNLIIPLVVIRELDGIKKEHSYEGRAAREVSRYLDNIGSWHELSRKYKNLSEGLTVGETTIITMHEYDDVHDGLISDADCKVIGTALRRKRIHPQENVCVLTRDCNMRIVSRAYGIPVKFYPLYEKGGWDFMQQIEEVKRRKASNVECITAQAGTMTTKSRGSLLLTSWLRKITL